MGTALYLSSLFLFTLGVITTVLNIGKKPVGTSPPAALLVLLMVGLHVTTMTYLYLHQGAA